MLVQDSLVDQPQAEGTFLSKLKSICLSKVIYLSFSLTVQEGGTLLGFSRRDAVSDPCGLETRLDG